MSETEPSAVGEFADALWRAQVGRTPISPLTDARPDLTVEDAYAIQRHNVDRRVAAGRLARGYKIGLTSRAVQQLLGAQEPAFGVLHDDMFVEDGEEIPYASMLQPRIQAGMAFVLADDLSGPGVTIAGALMGAAGVLPAIEIVDSRIADWRLGLVDTVADNASCARVVLGGMLIPVGQVDLRLIGMLLYRNGLAIDSGAGAAALGHPARCLAWLANRLGEGGSGLHRGDIVLAGALHRMTPARAGDVFRAEFARLGEVTARFGDGMGP